VTADPHRGRTLPAPADRQRARLPRTENHLRGSRWMFCRLHRDGPTNVWHLVTHLSFDVGCSTIRWGTRSYCASTADHSRCDRARMVAAPIGIFASAFQAPAASRIIASDVNDTACARAAQGRARHRVTDGPRRSSTSQPMAWLSTSCLEMFGLVGGVHQAFAPCSWAAAWQMRGIPPADRRRLRT